MRTYILTSLLLFAAAISASAQPGQESDPRLRYGDLIYAEAACFPSDSAGMARVDVFVRVSYDFMIFARSNGGSADSLYTAAVEISSSLLMKDRTVRTQHDIVRAAAGDYNATIMRDRYTLLRQTYYVEAGTYEVLIEVADKGSTRATTVRQPLRAVLLTGGAAKIGEPIPLRHETESGEQSFSVFAFGRALPFADRSFIGIPVSRDYQATWSVRLHALTEDDEEEEEASFDDTVQPMAVLPAFIPAGPAGEVESFSLRSSADVQGELVVLALPFEGLDVGRYRLVVRAEGAGSTDSTVIPVRIFWRDMPFSMRDPEFAIDAMRFILTSEEYDNMKSGSQREMQRAFRRYWKQRDSTPETEHNEMMAEYFRRVDQAYYKFQTLYIRNGIQTDRGKVYVLFGPPEDAQRVMDLEEPVSEVWEYPSLGKSFRFVDKSRDGNLRLIEE